jgi:hypothetical protein
VLGELQTRSLAVRFLFHPIFKTQRDKAGRLQTIAGAGDEKWGDGHQESYIAIHLRALRDTEARDLAATISDILAEVRVVVADWSPMLQRLETATRQLGPRRRDRRRTCCRTTAFRMARAGQLHLPRRALLRAHGRRRHRRPRIGGRQRPGVLRDAGCSVRRGSELVAMTPEVRRSSSRRRRSSSPKPMS